MQRSEDIESVLRAFLSFEEHSLYTVDAARQALPPAVLARLPELFGRLDAQQSAIKQNAVFLQGMMEELDLIHREQTPDQSPTEQKCEIVEDPLIRAVAAVRSTHPTATAKQVHAMLVMQQHWSELPLSAVKRACSKVAKATAATGSGSANQAARPGNDAQAQRLQAILAAQAGAADDPTRSAAGVAQENVHAVLMQLRREWSDDGVCERAESFGVILEALKQRLPALSADAPSAAVPVTSSPPMGVAAATSELPPVATTRRPRVLVPGAGLGRWTCALPVKLLHNSRTNSHAAPCP
jgi:hypothetical protein